MKKPVPDFETDANRLFEAMYSDAPSFDLNDPNVQFQALEYVTGDVPHNVEDLAAIVLLNHYVPEARQRGVIDDNMFEEILVQASTKAGRSALAKQFILLERCGAGSAQQADH